MSRRPGRDKDGLGAVADPGVGVISLPLAVQEEGGDLLGGGEGLGVGNGLLVVVSGAVEEDGVGGLDGPGVFRGPADDLLGLLLVKKLGGGVAHFPVHDAAEADAAADAVGEALHLHLEGGKLYALLLDAVKFIILKPRLFGGGSDGFFEFGISHDSVSFPLSGRRR